MEFENIKQTPLNTIINNQSELTSAEWDEIRLIAKEVDGMAERAGVAWKDATKTYYRGGLFSLADLFRLFCRMAEDARVYKEYGPYASGNIETIFRLDTNVERREEPSEEVKKAA